MDYTETAVEKARVRAKDSGVQVNFIVDDLTNLRHVSGTLDFLLDYGVLDDLPLDQREPYLHNMLPLTYLDSLDKKPYTFLSTYRTGYQNG